MMLQAAFDLDSWGSHDPYPNSAGFKTSGTSEDAAKEITPTIKQAHSHILGLLRTYPNGLTADEVASSLGWTVLYTRPRFSELKRLKFIMPTGARRPNSSGKNASVMVSVQDGNA